MSDDLKLFDDFERTDMDLLPEHEPFYKYLNRSAFPSNQYLRQLLQTWFNKYPGNIDKKNKLCHQFKRISKRPVPDKDHLSALFEIYLYVLFVRMGFQVEVEPEDAPEWNEGNKRPDFRLTTKTGQKILVEATGAYSTDDLKLTKKHEGELLDYLESHLKSDKLVIKLSSKTRPKEKLCHADVCRYIQQELDMLHELLDNNQAITHNTWALHDSYIYSIRMIEAFEWGAEFIVETKSYNEEPIVRRFLKEGPHKKNDNGARPPEHGIRQSLKEKYKRYGETFVPYIIAINVFYSFFHEKFDIINALFGDLRTKYPLYPDISEPVWERYGGAFIHNNSSQMTDVSGVLFFKQLQAENMTFNEPTLWHHPFAKHPLIPSNWKIHQKVANSELSIMEDYEGGSVSKLFESEDQQLRNEILNEVSR